MLRALIDSIDRNPRRVRVICVFPIRADGILGTGRFRVLKEQRSVLLDTPRSRATIFESLSEDVATREQLEQATPRARQR